MDPPYDSSIFTGTSLASGEVSFAPCETPGAGYYIAYFGTNSISSNRSLLGTPYDYVALSESGDYTFTEYYLAPGEAPEPDSFAWSIAVIGCLLWLARGRKREAKCFS